MPDRLPASRCCLRETSFGGWTLWQGIADCPPQKFRRSFESPHSTRQLDRNDGGGLLVAPEKGSELKLRSDLSISKMLSGANAFEINDIQEDETEARPNKDDQNVTMFQ
jgi:hypothetical protein